MDEEPHVAGGKDKFVVRVLCAILKKSMHGGTDKFGWLRLKGRDVINCWKNGIVNTACIVQEATNLLLKSFDFGMAKWAREVELYDGGMYIAGVGAPVSI